jgi:cellulose synthase/poly-beta-1,6-N-acetylglucosamine synthase-like glycosyltransferase/putative flippase GtrA
MLRRLSAVPAFISFAAGGAVIAVIGALMLEAMVRAGVPPLVAQGIQLTVTLALNFAYNYKITWRDRPRTGLRRQMAWFAATRGVTQAASWAGFAALTSLGLHYQLANGACLAGAMAVNFVTSDRIVFRSEKTARRKLRVSRYLRPRRALLAWSLIAAGIAGAWYLLGPEFLPAVLLCVAGFNLLVSGLETRWRLYGWRSPDAAAGLAWPEPAAPGAARMSFSLIIPARHEHAVIGDTLRRLLKQTHPRYQVIVSLCDDDGPTRAAVRAVMAEDRGGSRLVLVTDHYDKPSKPQQLNRALEACTGDVVGVIDAEDDVAEALLAHVEALFEKSRADVVQGGVQLMNLGDGLSKWFQVHNVLEYFFWFTSRMAFQARAGFVPLGGNTVFVRRDLLIAAGGWPLSLTEDCALGVQLATRFGAKVATAYSPDLVTREEAPPTVFNKEAGSLFWQRDRWVRGFLAEFMAGTWKAMPTRRQRFLAGYILATPFLQAASFVLLPLAMITVLAVKTPIGVTMLTFGPVLAIGLTVLSLLMGLREFSRAYGQQARIWHYASVLLLTPVYQVVLAAAAAVAVYKYAAGDTTWYKTGRAAEHRRVAVAVAAAMDGAPA